jgi:tRNA 2-thiouridine synthesizing protein A
MGYWASPVAVVDASAPLPGNTVHSPRAQDAIVRAGSRAPRGARPTMENPMKYDKEFDASGLACPMPIVKTKKSLADMAPGQVLRVVATDPGSVSDMQAFAEQTGNTLLSSGTENSKYVFFLKKA